MSQQRVIAVVTGTRAECGLLLSVMRAIKLRPELKLRVVVTGTNLTTGTWRDISAGGLRIDARIPMQKAGRTGRAEDVQSLARGIGGFGRLWEQWSPDLVLVLGDRIEALAAAAAASVGGARVGHIHAGDRAEGVADEAMRHAISKLAHLHFPATAASRQRLIRMGESPKYVLDVGSPAIDQLRHVKPADIALLAKFDLPNDAPYVLVLQHPIGAPQGQERQWMSQTLRALRHLAHRVLLPNADPGCEGILAAIKGEKITPLPHLPREVFLSLLKRAGALVGNSSAGLIEAAALRVPCVNIGPRQAGRERAGNVIDCGYGETAVAAAVQRAIHINRKRIKHPYGDGHTGEKIARHLALLDLDAVPVRKRNTY